jgi:hypothetical protein
MTNGPLERPGAWWRAGVTALVGLAACGLAMSWWLARPAVGPRPPLDAVALAATVEPGPPRPVLGAEPLAAGHWRFANATGAAFTASSAAEVQRAFAVLQADQPPAVDGRRAVPVLRLPLEAVRLAADAFAILPADAPLQVWTGRRVVGFERRSGAPPRLVMSERLALTAAEPVDALAAIEHLGRPLRPADLRVIALLPGAGATLGRAPRTDPATGRALVDVVDPAALASALPTLRGGLALIIGRPTPAAAELEVRTDRGLSARLALAPVYAAAAAAEVGLIVLQATNAIQPGGRNWYWRTIEVAGVPVASAAPTLGDALQAMLGGGPILVSAQAASERTTLSARRAEAAGLLDPATWRQALATATAEVLGQANVTVATLVLPSPARQAELDRRWIKALPTSLQLVVLGLGLAVVLGATTAWRWWQQVWPAETRSEYASEFGFRAAQGVRAMVFVVLFLPLAAPLAAPAWLWSRR